jgi:hypothetical protein
MAIREILKEIKYEIADKLFKADMDEAFQMGIREGARFAAQKITFQLDLQSEKIIMTKTEKKGYLKAVEVAKEQRQMVKAETGALL